MAYNFPPKQDLLVSGTNLKSINGVSLLGSGDLTISAASTNLNNLIAPTAINVQLRAPNGSVSSPSYSFTSTPNTGLYSNGTSLFLVAGGNQMIQFDPGDIYVTRNIRFDGQVFGLQNKGIAIGRWDFDTYGGFKPGAGDCVDWNSRGNNIGRGGEGHCNRPWRLDIARTITVGKKYGDRWTYGATIAATQNDDLILPYASTANAATTLILNVGDNLHTTLDIGTYIQLQGLSAIARVIGVSFSFPNLTVNVDTALGDGTSRAIIVKQAIASFRKSNASEALLIDHVGNVQVPNYILSPQVHNNGAYNSGTITIDWATSPVQTIVVQGNITLNFVNKVKGGAYALRIRQDGAGGTITWPSDVSWPGNTAPTLSSPGNMDIINFLFFTDLGKYLATSALNFPFTLTGDADAENFILNAGIDDETQQDAIRVLVQNLKAGANLWSKLAVIYPFVGGTAITHKYNLKNTAAYPLTFSGIWDHNSVGAKNTGSGAYADTLFLANQLTPTNFAFGMYTSEDSGVNVGFPWVMGAFVSDSSAGFSFSLAPPYSRYVYFGLNNGQGTVYIDGQTIFKGFFTASFRASNDKEFYRGSTSVNHTTTNLTPNPFPAHTVFLGGMNDLSSSTYYSPTRFAFAYIASSGLTSAEVVELNTAVQTFQTTLGRAV